MDKTKRETAGFKAGVRHLLRLDQPAIRLAHRVRTSQAGILWGSLLAAGMLLLTCLFWRSFFQSDVMKASTGRTLFILSLLLSLLAGATSALRIYPPLKAIRVSSIVYYLLVPVLALLLSESICGVYIYNFDPLTFFLNYLLFIMLYSIPAVFFGRFRQPILIMTPIIWGASMIASYVLRFRGTPLMPADILTVRTGMEVAGGYNYTPPGYMILGTWLFVEIMLLTLRMPKIKVRPKRKNLFRVLSLLLLLGVAVPFYTTDVAANNGIKPDFWNQARGYANRGTVLSFVLNTRYLIVETPEGYDAAQIPAIIEEVLDAHPDDPGIFQTAQKLQAQAAERAAAAEAEAGTEAAARTAEGAPAEGTDAGAAGTAATEVPVAEAAGDGAEAASRPTGDQTGLRGGAGALTPAEGDGSETDPTSENTGLDTPLAVTGTSTEDQPATSARLRNGETPNLIVIMNETLSDLRALGPFSTNQDYFPFLRRLTKNTIKGNLYMPVNGAGTSNSEFEFLTGNSMSLLPSGSNAYQLYVDTPLPSFTRNMTAQGYSATAYHTYYRAGWKRSIVYPLLGFDRYLALEDYFGEELVQSYRDGDITFYQYQRAIADLYPDSPKILMRRFISDAFDYEQLIKLYEERDPDVPFYLFNVTMQNHGGYTQSYFNFDEQVYLTSTENYYPQANRYLSLMYESDLALEGLVDYFSHQSEPTMIVVFGDHQPSLETGFTSEVLGKAVHLTLAENQRRYVTPFVIWTNYSSDSGYIEKMSSNYLSTLVLQQAGLATTRYNDYLSALYAEIPVIDTTGYISADDIYYTLDNETRYSALIDGYSKVVYNNLFDSLNKASELFTIPEEEEEAS